MGLALDKLIQVLWICGEDCSKMHEWPLSNFDFFSVVAQVKHTTSREFLRTSNKPDLVILDDCVNSMEQIDVCEPLAKLSIPCNIFAKRFANFSPIITKTFFRFLFSLEIEDTTLETGDPCVNFLPKEWISNISMDRMNVLITQPFKKVLSIVETEQILSGNCPTFDNETVSEIETNVKNIEKELHLIRKKIGFIGL